MTETTLCYIEHKGCYLMMFRGKKENDLNRGKWIGIGGHIEKGETPLQCIIREIREETGMKAVSPEYRGIVLFRQTDGHEELMHLFTATCTGEEPAECDEGEMSWVSKERIYDLPMWEGDRVFLDLLNKNAPFFHLTLIYDGDRLTAHHLTDHIISFPDTDGT